MAYRVLAIMSAVLFSLFVIAGIVIEVDYWPHSSCPANTEGFLGIEQVQAGDVTPIPGNSGETITWNNSAAPVGDCIGINSVANGTNQYTQTDLGRPITSYEGAEWVGLRAGAAAWIAWTLAMFLLACAVAAIPKPPKAFELIQPDDDDDDDEQDQPEVVG